MAAIDCIPVVQAESRDRLHRVDIGHSLGTARISFNLPNRNTQPKGLAKSPSLAAMRLAPTDDKSLVKPLPRIRRASCPRGATQEPTRP